jgi:hexosaminidase
MIGWEEIAQADIDGNAIAQHWASEEHATAAAVKGAKIIMSPSKKVYLDMQYDSTTRIGLHWAAYIEVDESYNWDPATRVKGITRENVLGVEAPLWSETVVNMEDIEYMAFPRLIGVAEIGWSQAEGRSWDEYKIRLGKHAPHLQKLGIDFYRSPKVDWGN